MKKIIKRKTENITAETTKRTIEKAIKRTVINLFFLFLVFCFAACGGNGGSADTSLGENGSENSVSGSLAENESDGSVSSNDEANVGLSSEENDENRDSEKEGLENDEEAETENETNILVAYFSATNTTEGVAKTIAEIVGGDIYEIVPEDPYTDADLDYGDDSSRSTLEMNDSSSRPAISGSVENMEKYDIIFIGYPIWWGEAPRIVNTFMESYDFSGKTIVPFCTSGGSGIGSSAENLSALTDGATWLSGRRLSGNASSDTVAEWIDGLGLNIG